MKRTIRFIFSLCLIATASLAYSEDFPKLSLKNTSGSEMQSLKERDYESAVAMKSGRFSLFYIDFRLGYGSTNPSYNVNSGTSVSDKSDGGFTAGAYLTLTLFDMLNFTTGLDFTKKNFGLTDTAIVNSVTGDYSNSYLNIPLTFNFGGQVSDKVGVHLSAGPYFGFLLGDNDNIKDIGLKNFDFGIDATLTGDYALNSLVSVILGAGAQFGGLNNLGSNPSLSNVKTTNFRGFTGLRVGL